MLGVMYALVAVGFTLFFGVLAAIHFSHGDIFMLGAFAGLTVLAGLKAAGLGGALLALPLTFAVSFVATCLVRLLAERVCVKPLALPLTFSVSIVPTGLVGVLAERVSARRPAHLWPLLAPFASPSLGLVIRESVLIFKPRGAGRKSLTQLLSQGGVELGGFVVR